MGWDRRVVLDPDGLARLGVAPGGAGWAGGGKRPLDFPIFSTVICAWSMSSSALSPLTTRTRVRRIRENEGHGPQRLR